MVSSVTILNFTICIVFENKIGAGITAAAGTRILIYAIGAGITAAAGTSRLRVRLPKGTIF